MGQTLLMKARAARVDALGELENRKRAQRASRRKAIFCTRRGPYGAQSMDRLFSLYNELAAA